MLRRYCLDRCLFSNIYFLAVSYYMCGVVVAVVALRAFSQKEEVIFSGTTAVSVLMREDQLWIANAGDSRAVLATEEEGALKAVDLSVDQNPNSPTEQVHNDDNPLETRN